jgi:cyclophilin family peptidyl-prolyl cis-trans isomerase
MDYPRHVTKPSIPHVYSLGVVVLSWLLVGAVGCSSTPSGESKAAAKSSGGLHATIETDKGPIELEFLPMDAPKAVENFRLLAERGFYDNLTFHEDEIKQDSQTYKDGYRRGIVAMANAGPNTNGSQFFIMHQDYPLPPAYVIFARVTKGIEVVDAIAETPTTRGPDGGMSQPLTPPKMKKVTIRP